MTKQAIADWVGRTRRTSDLIAPFQTSGMAATLDRKRAPGEGESLPPGWHWLFFADLPRQSALGPDGHERRGDFLPPVPLPRRMWAGNRLAFHRPLRVGRTRAARQRGRFGIGKAGGAKARSPSSPSTTSIRGRTAKRRWRNGTTSSTARRPPRAKRRRAPGRRRCRRRGAARSCPTKPCCSVIRR